MRVGIVGGGQLGRMLVQAGTPMGLKFRVLDPVTDCPAGQVAELIPATYDDEDALKALVTGCGGGGVVSAGGACDVVTYEFENVPAKTARFLESCVPVFPPSGALAITQDRLEEKRLFQQCGAPTAEFRAVSALSEVRAAATELGLPCVLKTRREGYDGKGQIVIQTEVDLARVEGLAQHGVKAGYIVEQFIRFARELSILMVRGRDGQCVFYPLVQNTHSGGILRRSVAPAPNVSADLQEQGERIARALGERMGYVGVLAVEFFECNDRGRSLLIGNEMAPRVHNSGHWTIEGAETSQFENHLRAILGWPLGSTAVTGASVMLNQIGCLADRPKVLGAAGAHWHDYGKEAREGRKVGHITITRRTLEEATAAAAYLCAGG